MESFYQLQILCVMGLGLILHVCRPAQDVDPLGVVLERSQFSSKDLQGFQHLPILQILQILLLQQQELHPLCGKHQEEQPLSPWDTINNRF